MLRLIKNNTSFVLMLFFILFLLAVLMLPSNPIDHLPGQDNGVFLYGGQQVLAGRIPYLDFWDHKGPLIYYINALGLFLGSGSRWGVWAVEFLFLFLTAIGLASVVNKNWQPISSLVVLLFWFYFMKSVGSYYRFGDSNYIETYGLLFNVWAVLFWVQVVRSKEGRWGYFFIGNMAGLSFSLRPNNVAVYVAIALVEIIVAAKKKQFAGSVKRVATMFAGCLLVFAVIFVWFEMHDALPQLLDAVFAYNLAYSKQNFSGSSVLLVFKYGLTNLFWMPLVGWLGVLFKLIYVSIKSKTSFPEEKMFAAFLLIWSLIEAIFSAISGRALLHYYINWTVFTSLLMTGLIFFFASAFLPTTSTYERFRKFSKWLAWISALLLFLANLSALHQYWRIADYVVKNGKSEPPKALIETIRNSTNTNDKVLVWGNDVWINFLSDRRSPSKYSYQYPLFMKGYTNEQLVSSFLEDLSTCPPIYIVEPIVNTNEILPLGRDRRDAARSLLEKPAGITQVYVFFDTNYRFVRDFNNVDVYKWIGDVNGNISCR